MKKLLIAALALVSLASCSKSEVIGEVEKDVITFGNTFIENSTKSIDPSATVEKLQAFQVYGTVSNGTATANIFNGVEVSKNTNTNQGTANGDIQWGYSEEETQYWIPDNTYKFVAIANATTTENDTYGIPTKISFTNTDGTTDLLYAVNNYDKFTADSPKCVAFTFNHLLSKVKFTFVNGYPANSNLKVKVSDVKITNALKSGEYTISLETWAPASGNSNDVTLEFGNIVAAANANTEDSDAGEITPTGTGTDSSWDTGDGLSSNYERLLIPGAKQNLKIYFKAEVYYEDVLVKTIDKSTVPSEVTATLEAGNSYNITGVVGGQLDIITFTVDKIGDWTQETNPDNVTLN